MGEIGDARTSEVISLGRLFWGALRSSKTLVRGRTALVMLHVSVALWEASVASTDRSKMKPASPVQRGSIEDGGGEMNPVAFGVSERSGPG